MSNWKAKPCPCGDSVCVSWMVHPIAYTQGLQMTKADAQLIAAAPEMLELTTRMAQELQDFIAEAERAGSSLAGTTELVDEWEVLFKEINSAH